MKPAPKKFSIPNEPAAVQEERGLSLYSICETSVLLNRGAMMVGIV
jgi:hypothetical protein